MKQSSALQMTCWFCNKEGCDAFDYEFDTFVHTECLREALQKSNNEEAEIMKYLIEEKDDARR